MKVPKSEERPIALRAYAVPQTSKENKNKTANNNYKAAPLGYSHYTLTFDTETTTTAEQRLRVGNYQLRKAGALIEEGFFFDPDALNAGERRRLRYNARRHGLKLLTVSEFNDQIFYGVAYRKNALIIGFNLPFDLSRLAIRHESAKNSPWSKMGGGFSLKLHENWPPVRIKHLSRTTSLYSIASPGGQKNSRSMRRRGHKRPTKRGYFLEVRSLAAALTGGSHTLASLAQLLETKHQKIDAEHGQELTAKYLDYLRNDVQVTYECYEVLSKRYESFKLDTPVNNILSEASIGKASLKQMGVRPWREVQPDFPPELTGIIMSTYFGGRSEVHLRRVVTSVAYCDFLSMYPTVSVLQEFWRFVIAEGIDWRDETAETQVFVDSLELSDLAKPETWKKLTVLVQVEPDADLFPIRSKYDDGSPAFSIGLNILTSKEPLWFTLADALVSKLLTGRTPKIKRALVFTPRAKQSGLKPIDILGNPDYRIDPAEADFYLRLTQLRSSVKQRMRCSTEKTERDRLDSEQLAMKIIDNSCCYGIFVELNVQEHTRKQWVTYYGGDESPRTANLTNIEEPGRNFHPLVATLTTGAARLMLGAAEALAKKEGLSWALCDTDSMALASPEGMPQSEFLKRVETVRNWFEQLNPYGSGNQLFKLEDNNFGLDKGLPEPLYCFAVSAKRYCLFNIGAEDKPILRKASAHGLGHLLEPYNEKAPAFIPAPKVQLSEIGVSRWQHDLWYLIVEATLAGHSQQVDLGLQPGIDSVAVSRYAATCPRLLKWFKSYNEDKPYNLQVRPFNFLNSYPARSTAELGPTHLPGDEAPRAVSPFDYDQETAVKRCFDRNTCKPVPPELLRTYRQALARYHLHPEAKFIGGDFTESGELNRRHIRVPGVNGIMNIGKEAHRLEERSKIGDDPGAQIVYGVSGGSLDVFREQVALACRKSGVRPFAQAAGVSHSTVLRFLKGEVESQVTTLNRLLEVITRILNESEISNEAL